MAMYSGCAFQSIQILHLMKDNKCIGHMMPRAHTVPAGRMMLDRTRGERVMTLAQPALDESVELFLWRGDAGYEPARRSMWNWRVPPRYPDVIARPRRDEDVVAAVRLARQRGLKIAIRSGGHSWAATFLRDGGMLIDLAAMKSFSIDADARIATIQPGLRGTDLNRALRQHGLFFPTGHCRTVGLGGFLLQ